MTHQHWRDIEADAQNAENTYIEPCWSCSIILSPPWDNIRVLVQKHNEQPSHPPFNLEMIIECPALGRNACLLSNPSKQLRVHVILGAETRLYIRSRRTLARDEVHKTASSKFSFIVTNAIQDRNKQRLNQRGGFFEAD
jgi:hypothetical protein